MGRSTIRLGGLQQKRLTLIYKKKEKMDFKNYLILGIGSILGSAFGVLISNKVSPRQLAAKGVAALLIGFYIIPAFMPYFELPIQVWSGINAVSAVVGVEVVVLLTKKVKDFIINKIKTE